MIDEVLAKKFIDKIDGQNVRVADKLILKK